MNSVFHMTKMAAKPIYGKNHSKIFSSRTRRPMILKLGMKHQAMELYKVYISHDPDLFYGKINISRISQISGERL